MKPSLKILIWGLLLIILAVFVWYVPELKQLFSYMVDFVRENSKNNPIASIAVFIALSGLSAMFAPLSSVPLVPFAIAAWGNFDTLKFLLTGWLMGGALTYAIGRYATHPFLRRLALYQKIEAYRGKITSRSEFGLVLLFRLALPAEIPGYVLGAIKYSFWKYMFATFISELFIAILAIYMSEAFLAKNGLIFISLAALGILFFSFFIIIFRKKLKFPD